MENTTENKAKFFAQYWGQPVVDFTESNILTRDELNTCYVSIPNISFPMLKYSCLLLTPISSITDEDFIESQHERISLLKEMGLDYKFIRENTEPTLAVFKGEMYWDTVRLNIKEMRLSESDYIRSKGYALPYMGLSVDKLLEYGWIKL